MDLKSLPESTVGVHDFFCGVYDSIALSGSEGLMTMSDPLG